MCNHRKIMVQQYDHIYEMELDPIYIDEDLVDIVQSLNENYVRVTECCQCDDNEMTWIKMTQTEMDYLLSLAVQSDDIISYNTPLWVFVTDIAKLTLIYNRYVNQLRESDVIITFHHNKLNVFKRILFEMLDKIPKEKKLCTLGKNHGERLVPNSLNYSPIVVDEKIVDIIDTLYKNKIYTFSSCQNDDAKKTWISFETKTFEILMELIKRCESSGEALHTFIQNESEINIYKTHTHLFFPSIKLKKFEKLLKEFFDSI